MKKNTLLEVILFLLLALPAIVLAQNKKEHVNSNQNSESLIRCYTDEHNHNLKQDHPNMMGSEFFERQMQEKIAQNQSNRSQMVVLTIPVVVHVFHNGEAIGVGPNISDAQVESQITVMNQDYRRMMGTPGFNNHVDGADVEVEFCLAQQTPDGTPTNGINRVNIGTTISTEAQMESLKTTTYWDAANYMNMWSASFTGDMSGLLGYAQFPGGAAETDGVVAGYNYFGSSDFDDGSFTLSSPYDKGRTMTHEVGHYLGLFHTFQDTSCTEGAGLGDLCADTPAISDANFGCPTGNDSCSGGELDMIENYMDYTNDSCMNIFTNDQKARVVATLTSVVNRQSLTTSSACNSSSIPFITMTHSIPSSMDEGTACSTVNYTVSLRTSQDLDAQAIVSLNVGGTAIEGEDFDLLNNSVTFAQGSSTPSNDITLVVYSDGVVELDENIQLNLEISTSGNALVSGGLVNSILVNDDVVASDSQSLIYFEDDFNDEDISDWTLVDADFDGNNWGDQFIVTDDSGNAATPVSLISRSWLQNPLTPNNWAISPAFDLSSASGEVLLTWVVQSASNVAWNSEKYSVHVGTANTISSLLNSAVTLTEIVSDVSATGGPISRDLDISSLVGESTVYIAFRHWDTEDMDFLSIDDVTVAVSSLVGVQEEVNTSTAKSYTVIANGESTFRDDSNGNYMVSLENSGANNYGCVEVFVSRSQTTAGAPAVDYGQSGVANQVMAKTFQIDVDNTVNGAHEVAFYFTAAEIDAWENATGNSRNDLEIIQQDAAIGGTPTTIASFSTTLSNFGDNIILTGVFDAALGGTYLFGVESSLSVEENAFDFLGVYPNPTDGVVSVSIENSALNDVQINLYDMRGRMVSNEKFTNSASNFTTTLNYSNISQGVYIMKIQSGNDITSRQLIIK